MDFVGPAIPNEYSRPPDSFKYPSKPLVGGQFRLLRLLPGRSGEELFAELVTVTLNDEAIIYDALSYTWGAWTARRTITLNNSSGFHVTDNVFNALQRLKLRGEVRTIWIDAICIDQANVKERNEQLQVIGDIYRRARAVIVWLGNIDEGQILRRGSLTRRFKQGAAFNLFEQQSLLMALLGTRPQWWDRVWVVQEVVKARQDPVIHFGRSKVSWGEFLAAAKLYLSTANRNDILPLHNESFRNALAAGVRAVLSRLPASHNPEPRSEGDSLLNSIVWAGHLVKFKFNDAMMRLVHPVANLAMLKESEETYALFYAALDSLMFRMDAFSTHRLKPAGNYLIDTAWRLRDLQVTDPHDKVYSLLGMIRAETARLLNPDYNTPVNDLFALATFAALSESSTESNFRALKLVTFGSDRPDLAPWKGKRQQPRTPGLASWAVDFMFPEAFAYGLDTWNRFEPVERAPTTTPGRSMDLSPDFRCLKIPGCFMVGHVSQVVTVPRSLAQAAVFHDQVKAMLQGLPSSTPYLAEMNYRSIAESTLLPQSKGFMPPHVFYDVEKLEEARLITSEAGINRAFEIWDLAVWHHKTQGPGWNVYTTYETLPNGHVRSVGQSPDPDNVSWNPRNRPYGKKIDKFADDTYFSAGGFAMVATSHGFLGIANRYAEVGDLVVMVDANASNFMLVRPKDGAHLFLGFVFVHGYMRGELQELHGNGLDWSLPKTELTLI